MILFGQFWEEIIATFAQNMLLRSEEMGVYKVVKTAKEAVKAVSVLKC